MFADTYMSFIIALTPVAESIVGLLGDLSGTFRTISRLSASVYQPSCVQRNWFFCRHRIVITADVRRSANVFFGVNLRREPGRDVTRKTSAVVARLLSLNGSMRVFRACLLSPPMRVFRPGWYSSTRQSVAFCDMFVLTEKKYTFTSNTSLIRRRDGLRLAAQTRNTITKCVKIIYPLIIPIFKLR